MFRTLPLSLLPTLWLPGCSGGGGTSIDLLEIVVGERIWWRGSVTGLASIDASMVRVRVE